MPSGRRADAVAEAEHHQRMPARRDDFEALGAAHPVRHLHRLGAHVLEAVLLISLDRPLDRGLEVGRAAEAMAEGVAELGEALPGGVGRPRSPISRRAGSR